MIVDECEFKRKKILLAFENSNTAQLCKTNELLDSIVIDEVFGAYLLKIACDNEWEFGINYLYEKNVVMDHYGDLCVNSVHAVFSARKMRSLRCLLQCEADAQQKDENGLNLLDHACLTGDEEQLEYILKNMCVLQLNSENLESTITLCLSKQLFRCLEQLLSYSTQPSYLQVQAASGSTPQLDRMLDYHPDTTTIYTSLENPQHRLCNSESNTSVVPLLVGDVNENMDGSVLKKLIMQNEQTAIEAVLKQQPAWFTRIDWHDILFLQCSQNKIDIISLFLQYEKSFNSIGTHFKKIIIFNLCKLGYYDILELLLQDGSIVPEYGWDNDWTPLHVACNYGRLDIIRVFLQGKHFDVNALTIEGYSPLYIAVGNGYTEVVELLLRYNSNVNHATYIHDTALGISSNSARHQISRLLLQHKANVNAIIQDGNTPLYNAARNCDLEMVKLLLDYGADPNISTLLGDTPLKATIDCASQESFEADNSSATKTRNESIYSNCIDIVKSLLDQNADVLKPNADAQTALSSASSQGFVPLVKLLLQHTPQPLQLQPQLDHSALYLACEAGHSEIVEILLQAKADPTQVEKSGVTALCTSRRLGNTSIIESLLRYTSYIHENPDEHG